MPQGAEKIIAFGHPLIAVLTLVFLARVASLGLRSRERGGAELRPRHAALAPWTPWIMGANFAFGVGSTWWLRDDLDLMSGWHFHLGWIIVLVLVVAGRVSRRLPEDENARRIHPLIGMLALLLAAVQVFLGLPLLPL